MTQLPSDHGGDEQPTDSGPRRDPTVSRRGVLEATGAGIAGAGLASVAGTASAAGVTIAPLARDGNRIVDPQGEAVTLRGVNVVDPARANRSWRGMDAEAVFDMATAHPDWSNSIVRVPIEPPFVATGAAAAFGPQPADLPHGDDWGPAMPGTFDETALRRYLEGVVDPLVAKAEENGAYVMLDYHRYYPIFHHHEHEEYVKVHGGPLEDACYEDITDVWDCAGDVGVDHTVLEGATEEFPVRPTEGRVPEVCGERGILWHGEDQIDEVRDLAVEQNVVEYWAGIETEDDVYTEPAALCNALDREVRLFWKVVADEYGDSDAVLFDVYDEPTGPYAGDWGGPERVPGALAQAGYSRPDEHKYELWGEYAKPWYDLWVERSQPWMNVAENHGAGNVQTIGNPRWSQYVYWAPYNEYDTENVCYTAHVQTQEDCRPLQCTVGPAAEHVPVFFSDFGWMNFDRVVPTPWLDGGIEFATGEHDPYHEGIEENGVAVQIQDSMSFGQFFDEFPVHPICSAFDLDRRPNFFESGCPDGGEFRGTSGARGSDHWHDDGHLIEEDTPGGWWQAYVNDRGTTVNQGTSYYPILDAGPSALHGTTDGYAFPTGEKPADCGSSTPTCEGAGGSGVEVDGRTVCDVNGDGYYRDVTGDGTVGQTDVVEFFQVQHREAWKQPSMFDFSGNGEVGHGDVVALFEYVATGGA